MTQAKQAIAALGLLVLSCTGCLARELRAPTQRHALETDIVVQRCEVGEYYKHPCGSLLIEDLKITAEQAALIYSIVAEDGKGE